jgi:uncharacterized delta-60 repeat protein
VAAAAVSFGVFPVGVALASAGGLDPSFGSGGIAFTAFGETYGFDAVGAIAIQRDGRIVAAGGGGPNSFALARYKDGVLDPGFGHDGKVLTDFDGFGTAGAVAIRPNGKIIAAGSGYGGPAGAQKVDFAVAQYNEDGSLDRRFGHNGKVLTDIGGGTGDWLTALVILPNAKIVVGGYSTGGYAAATNELVRYNGDGSLDPSFGNGGIAFIDFSVEDLAIQPNGDLVAAGYRDGPDRPEFAVARYTPTGHPDPAFGSAGTVVTDFGATDIATSVVLEPNGRIIAAGYSDTNTDMQDIAQDYDFALAGYTQDGHLDTTFGHDGLVLTDNASINDYGYDAALAPDGRLVVAGTDGINFAVTRYETNGTVEGR